MKKKFRAEPRTSAVNIGGGAYIDGNVDADIFGERDLVYGYAAKQVTALIIELRHGDQRLTWNGLTPYRRLALFQEPNAELFSLLIWLHKLSGNETVPI